MVLKNTILRLAELLQIVPFEGYAAIINKKMFRGERLFRVLLEKASNYDCIQMHNRTTNKGLMAGQTLSYIIESIDEGSSIPQEILLNGDLFTLNCKPAPSTYQLIWSQSVNTSFKNFLYLHD